MATKKVPGGLGANYVGFAKLPRNLTTKPPSGKSRYNIPPRPRVSR